VRSARPLPETEAFVGYLFRLVERDATARLGYSYWAEGCYPFLDDFVVSLRREVKEILASSCKDDRALQEGVVDVLATSLHLMRSIFDAVHERHPER